VRHDHNRRRAAEDSDGHERRETPHVNVLRLRRRDERACLVERERGDARGVPPVSPRPAARRREHERDRPHRDDGVAARRRDGARRRRGVVLFHHPSAATFAVPRVAERRLERVEAGGVPRPRREQHRLEHDRIGRLQAIGGGGDGLQHDLVVFHCPTVGGDGGGGRREGN